MFFATVLRKKYKKIEDEPIDNNYFDARKLDYDEEVYYIGNADDRRKEIGKSFLSKVALNAPSIGLYLLGAGFLSIAFVGLLGLLF